MRPAARQAMVRIAGRSASGHRRGRRRRNPNPASTCQAPAPSRRRALGRATTAGGRAPSGRRAVSSVTLAAYQSRRAARRDGGHAPPSACQNGRSSPESALMNDVLSVILGGGRGSRLFPLTVQRSKPAVPIAGKYRLIDIPISNCLNSDLRRIFVLTQYNSESLNKHIGMTYKFDLFSSAFVSVLAAEQTEESGDWFQGTADAVRQNKRHLANHDFRDVLILAGDQLYLMDFARMLETHRRHVADVTVAVTPVADEQATGFGILKMNGLGRITHFEEKPSAERLPQLVSDIPTLGSGLIASMGIYLFKREALEAALKDPALVDFGRHVIPAALARSRVQAHVHRGYWED